MPKNNPKICKSNDLSPSNYEDFLIFLEKKPQTTYYTN